jgi:hypothetical protein
VARKPRKDPARGRLPSPALALAAALAALGPGAQVASAAAPSLSASWSSQVLASAARLNARVNPQGLSTTYHFDYLTKAAYEANGANFNGASRVPPVSEAAIGSGSAEVSVFQFVSNLQADTVYYFRVVAKNASGTTFGPTLSFHTFAAALGTLLPDGRGWEMVSPPEKNGGAVAYPETLAHGGLLQAAVAGGALTYSSSTSFAGGQGAPPASQYLATRNAGGWSTENLTVPIFSGSYDTVAGGAPYRLFSPDLTRGLLLNGKRCRGEAEEGCPVANPPLPGSDAPAGYQDYYMRTPGPGFEALLGSADVANAAQSAADFTVRLAGASADLGHVVLASCSRLTPTAVDGCPAQENLYEWVPGGPLRLLNGATSGAMLAAPAGAVSDSGARVYLYAGGDLYLNDGGTLKAVDGDAGGGGTFQLASADGAFAYFTKAGHLWRYSLAAQSASDLTPSGGVAGVLGAAADGSHLYYLSGSGLRLCADARATASCDAASTEVASGADAGNYPPATGTARVTADGTVLAFLSATPLEDQAGNTYDNTDLATGNPDSQVYLYNASDAELTCASCNPTGGRPIGPASIPGAIANGAGPTATITYKPRALSADGRRLFFDSADALALTDTNATLGGAGISDVYEWEAQGEGGCTRSGGCLALISSGREPGGARFADASADGTDAFFLTDESLVKADPGGADLYDARVGGGFPDPPVPIACNGDSCQALPPDPGDPTLTTLLTGPGNPPVRYHRHRGAASRCPKGRRSKLVRTKSGKRVRRCVKKGAKHGGGR